MPKAGYAFVQVDGCIRPGLYQSTTPLSPAIRGSNSQRRTLVEECDLLGCRCLEHLDPSQQLISFYARLLHAPALNPVEENIHWRREIVQLNSSAKGSGSESQCIPLGPSPSAPFDDYGETKREKFLTPTSTAEPRSSRGSLRRKGPMREPPTIHREKNESPRAWLQAAWHVWSYLNPANRTQ